MDIKIKDLSKVDFNSPEIKKQYEEVKERNKRLLDSTKVDWRQMYRTFDV